MKKGERTRATMLESTAQLLQQQGYNGTGVKQILEASGAPRGSFYFHFPGGKEQLACEALAMSGKKWRDRLMAAVGDDVAGPAQLGRAIALVCGELAERMEASDFSAGCPMATVVLEAAATSDEIQRVTGEHFTAWQQYIKGLLTGLGVGAAAAGPLATLVLSSIEGALLLSRAQRSRKPLDDVAIALSTMTALLPLDRGSGPL